MKNAIKTPTGLRTVMALLGAEDSSNKALQAESTTSTTEATVPAVSETLDPAFPATQVKLSSILKR